MRAKNEINRDPAQLSAGWRRLASESTRVSSLSADAFAAGFCRLGRLACTLPPLHPLFRRSSRRPPARRQLLAPSLPDIPFTDHPPPPSTLRHRRTSSPRPAGTRKTQCKTSPTPTRNRCQASGANPALHSYLRPGRSEARPASRDSAFRRPAQLPRLISRLIGAVAISAAISPLLHGTVAGRLCSLLSNLVVGSSMFLLRSVFFSLPSFA